MTDESNPQRLSAAATASLDRLAASFNEEMREAEADAARARVAFSADDIAQSRARDQATGGACP